MKVKCFNTNTVNKIAKTDEVIRVANKILPDCVESLKARNDGSAFDKKVTIKYTKEDKKDYVSHWSVNFIPKDVSDTSNANVMKYVTKWIASVYMMNDGKITFA